MSTKIQAKTAVDSAATAIKADIDNILPAAVNITDGNIAFAPTRWTIQMNAGDQATALSWSSSIQTALTAASRSFTVETGLGRRQGDGGPKVISIFTTLAT